MRSRNVVLPMIVLLLTADSTDATAQRKSVLAPSPSCQFGCWEAATLGGRKSSFKGEIATFWFQDDGALTIQLTGTKRDGEGLVIIREAGRGGVADYGVANHDCLDSAPEDPKKFSVQVTGPSGSAGPEWSLFGVNGNVTVKSISKTRIVGTFDLTASECINDKSVKSTVRGVFKAFAAGVIGS